MNTNNKLNLNRRRHSLKNYTRALSLLNSMIFESKITKKHNTVDKDISQIFHERDGSRLFYILQEMKRGF